MAEGTRAELEPGSLRKLVRASKTWDTVSRREMRKTLRTAASRSADDAKNAVLGPPPPGGGGSRTGATTGLRSGLSRGVKISIRSGTELASGDIRGEGVRVIVDSSHLPEKKAAMVKAYMAKTFRHPVFGQSVWVSQAGKNWFYGPLYKGREEYKQAIIEAIEAASEAIARD